MTHSNRTHSSTFSPVTAITRLTSFEPVTNSHKPKVRSMQALATLPALFISHGAPTFALEKSATTNALARTGQNLPKPKAIVIMSAHWVTQTLEIASNPTPQTWHDFSGFSHELNRIEYPALGHPELAESLSNQLNKMGVINSLNPLRPLDHGVWVPLLHLYPEADVPIVQLSLPKHFDAYACYQLGSLFEQLRHEQILVIGSGSITHNLAALSWNASSEDASAKAFKVWLLHQLKTDIPAALDWQQFAQVEQVHPSAEHLLPLFFALGCGQRVSVIHESMSHHSLGMDMYRFD
ncbi:DODA-type extradiol aromatic ring-opening family dioxygenase [Psychrobacter sp. H7-1]|uniref:DODA-type extradiol aromatic ring-opening family dioxygenase n=1 Tax=Psychrobacter sp. H7-1 TaxID=1569265 RepID=UPI001D0F81FF|nr:class III extradiol ring-cleavage dioxygenase [Psychrobacter sp. H7-1]